MPWEKLGDGSLLLVMKKTTVGRSDVCMATALPQAGNSVTYSNASLHSPYFFDPIPSHPLCGYGFFVTQIPEGKILNKLRKFEKTPELFVYLSTELFFSKFPEITPAGPECMKKVRGKSGTWERRKGPTQARGLS